jgi:hypothetical protein
VLLLAAGWPWRERRTTHLEASMPSCLLLHQVLLVVQQVLLLLAVEAAVLGSSVSLPHLE